MDNVAKQIADYKMEVKQNILLAMLKGIFLCLLVQVQ